MQEELKQITPGLLAWNRDTLSPAIEPKAPGIVTVQAELEPTGNLVGVQETVRTVGYRKTFTTALPELPPLFPLYAPVTVTSPAAVPVMVMEHAPLERVHVTELKVTDPGRGPVPDWDHVTVPVTDFAPVTFAVHLIVLVDPINTEGGVQETVVVVGEVVVVK